MENLESMEEQLKKLKKEYREVKRERNRGKSTIKMLKKRVSFLEQSEKVSKLATSGSQEKLLWRNEERLKTNALVRKMEKEHEEELSRGKRRVEKFSSEIKNALNQCARLEAEVCELKASRGILEIENKRMKEALAEYEKGKEKERISQLEEELKQRESVVLTLKEKVETRDERLRTSFAGQEDEINQEEMKKLKYMVDRYKEDYHAQVEETRKSVNKTSEIMQYQRLVLEDRETLATANSKLAGQIKIMDEKNEKLKEKLEMVGEERRKLVDEIDQLKEEVKSEKENSSMLVAENADLKGLAEKEVKTSFAPTSGGDSKDQMISHLNNKLLEMKKAQIAQKQIIKKIVDKEKRKVSMLHKKAFKKGVMALKEINKQLIGEISDYKKINYIYKSKIKEASTLEASNQYLKTVVEQKKREIARRDEEEAEIRKFLEHENVGFMRKQGDKNYKSIKWRWFKFDSNGFSYFKERNDKKAVKTIPFESGMKVVKTITDDIPTDKNLSTLSFGLVTKSRTFVFYATCPSERERWVFFLNKWIKNPDIKGF